MSDKKRVLFISYYWPPSGKASLHWPLRIIKHLPSFEWEPVVLTVKEESFTKKDLSLLSEIDPNLKVCKTNVFEVFNLYKKFIGKKTSESLSVSETMSVEGRGLKQKFSMWIRMNLFVPDARVTWYFSAVKEAKAFIDKMVEEDGKGIDAVISIGTPHSTHLIGRKLKKIFNIPHIPVFTDPWVSISYYEKFKRSYLTEAFDNYLEKKICTKSESLIFVTDNTRLEYEDKYPSIKEKTNVLYWGYNEESFSDLNYGKDNESNEKIILHTGNLFDYQNPINFWKTIKSEVDKGAKFKLKFTGTVGPAIIKSIDENGLSNVTEYLGFLPYDELVEQLRKADYLMVCSYNNKHIPGKTFEYLRIGKPIIAFCDDNNELERILKESNSGSLYKYNDYADDFFKNADSYKTKAEFVKQFDRYEITKELTKILNKITG